MSKGFERKLNDDGSENTKYIDLLDEDKPLSGQKFVCVSFVSPENIIKQKFEMIGKTVDIKPSIDIDTVQQNSKNVASNYLTNWWKPTTTLAK